MSDTLLDDWNDIPDNRSRVARPSLAQVKAVVAFMEKHPDMAHRKLRFGTGNSKFKKMWLELANSVNSMGGAVKSTKGWVKFWSDKRRSLVIKQRHIEEGKIHGSITPLERKILELSEVKVPVTRRKKEVKALKEEPCNGEEDEEEEIGSFHDDFSKDRNSTSAFYSTTDPSEADDRHYNMMQKVLDVMGQQSHALSQLAQASLSQSKALERVAEASHIQALAVDRLAGTFDAISGSVHEVRNAIVGIDYTMKRCYPANTTQPRQNSNIFT